MQKFILNSRDYGPVEFECPESGGYVFARYGRHGGPHNGQICRGGRVTGETLTAGGQGRPPLETVARRWWKQYQRRYR